MSKQIALETYLQESEKNQSLLEKTLRSLDVSICDVFGTLDHLTPVSFEPNGQTLKNEFTDKIASSFSNVLKKNGTAILNVIPRKGAVTGKRIAALFSGGPASGGHNVLNGIKAIIGEKNTLYGVNAGPKGLIQGDLFEVTTDALSEVMNLGGFDFLGSDRTKIKTEAQFDAVKKTVKRFKLDAIIVIGGDDSNTNAAILAEYLSDISCAVVGVPKTIDGDLQVDGLLPISFGFDTATKIYSEMVGNILQDTPSSRKYWHFVKLMGRSASQVALEVALQTKPALTLISEEVQEKEMSLKDIIFMIARTIAFRAGKGIHHGVIIIPEGLIEFIPEFKNLITELNELMSKFEKDLDPLTVNQKSAFMEGKLTQKSAQLMGSLPKETRDMLLLERDSHGNLQVSLIPTERLLIEMTRIKLVEMKNHPNTYFGKDLIDLSPAEVKRFIEDKFNPLDHFFGYEGRCGAPTRFDATLTFNLGLIAGCLALDGKTGYMAALTDFEKGARPIALPLVGLINIERRHGKDEKVIKKALVETHSRAFLYFENRRSQWAVTDCFSSPGPRQFWGPTSHQMPILVALNQGYIGIEFNIGSNGSKA